MSNIKTDLEVNSLRHKCLTLPVLLLFDIKNTLLGRGIDILIKVYPLFLCSVTSLKSIEHLYAIYLQLYCNI